MAEEVIAIKLVSGEEVISRVKERGDTTITLDRPNMIAIAPGPGGQVGIQLVPWFVSNQDGTFNVSLSSIVAETTPAKELEAGYLEKTSGIALTGV